MFFCVIFNFSNFLSPTLKKLRSERFAFALFVCSFIRYSVHNTLPYVQKMDIGLAERGYQVNIFLISPRKRVVGTQRSASNEYPKHMFLWKNKKNINSFGPKKHSHVPAAEGFLPPKFVSYPKIEESLYMLLYIGGTKIRK